MNRLRKLVIAALQNPKKKDCNCGCGGCSSKRIGPILNEGIVFNTPLSDNLKYYIDNNIPLNRRINNIKSKDYNKIITEARSLYSRLALNVNNKKDIKILTEKKITKTFAANAKEMFGPVKGGNKTLDREFSKMFNENEAEDYSKYYEAFQDQFQDILKKLSDIDTSIDFVAAGVTGKDPIDIDIDQKTMGRFASAGKAAGIKENIANIIKEGWPTGLLSLLAMALYTWANKKGVKEGYFEFEQKDWIKADDTTKASLLNQLYGSVNKTPSNLQSMVGMEWEELVLMVSKELGDKLYTN